MTQPERHDIEDYVTGPLNLLLVDLTCNTKNFEYQVSDNICKDLIRNKISVVNDSVFKITEFDQISQAFNFSSSYNSVLLFAHGSRPDQDNLNEFVLGNDSYSWALLNKLDIDLSGKHCFLCVCYAFNEAMINSLAKSSLFASPIVASKDVLDEDKNEVSKFFPPFLKELNNILKRGPEEVKYCLNKHNHFTNNKMLIYPTNLSEIEHLG